MRETVEGMVGMERVRKARRERNVKIQVFTSKAEHAQRYVATATRSTGPPRFVRHGPSSAFERSAPSSSIFYPIAYG